MAKTNNSLKNKIMADEVADKKTAWGKVILKIGETTADGAMAATLESLGYMKEDSVTLETAEGTKLQLFGTGHELIDELLTEPILTLKATVVGANMAVIKKLWKVTETGTGDTKKVMVQSMVTSKKFSVQMATEVIGSDTFEAPKCSVSMALTFSEKEGWNGTMSFTMLKAKDNTLFGFGLVPAQP